MADLYKIRIDKVKDNEVIATIFLHNFQASDLPLKNNIALQIISDSFYHMKHYPSDVNLDKENIQKLIQKTDEATLLNYQQMVGNHSQRDDVLNFLNVADQEILHLEYLKGENWELAKKWQAELESGKNVGETSMTAPSDTLRFSVKSIALIQHLVEGLEWTTPMFDREEML